jgi:hypothetical protein
MQSQNPGSAEESSEQFAAHDERHAGELPESELHEGDAAVTEQEAGSAPDGHAILAALEAQGRAGANWFYWIAALSVVNSAILLGGANRHFVIGLGVTQFIDGFAGAVAQQAADHATLIRGIAIGLNVFVIVVVLLFGWLSNQRFTSVFLFGMMLYLLDGLLFVLVGDWMSAAFHAFALYCMWRGFAAYRQLNALLAQPAADAG